MSKHRVVIVGGGFGGIYAATALRREPVELTVIDRRNFHLFQPLLYQVATGGLSPADITAPIRSILKRQRSTRVLLAEVRGIDPARRRIELDSGSVEYDSLILSTGVRHDYFGNDHWAEHAPGLKTVEDATRIRARVLSAFEAAERCPDAGEREAWMTFVVVGAGPTGVELAGAIGELARQTLRHEFRSFRSNEARILLVEGSERILPSYPPRLSAAAARSLNRIGVQVRTQTMVTAIDDRSTRLEHAGSVEQLPSRTVLWAAGVRASKLARVLAERTGVELDRSGRVRVASDCSIPGHPEILVIGDVALMEDPAGQPLPGVAPVAMQQGRYAARLIGDRLRRRPTPPFRYRDRGSLAVIGRAAAVADLGRLRFSGYSAWLLWLFIHIMYLVGFENRLLVFIRWAISYLTRKKGARLITGADTSREGQAPAAWRIEAARLGFRT